MKPISVRVNENDIEKLKELDIDLAELVRDVIKKAIKQSRCPVCGHVKGDSNDKLNNKGTNKNNC